MQWADDRELNSQEGTNDLATDHGFTGQKADGTGLMYYNARYYDPEIGQFISPDSLVPDVTNVFDYNRYMYVRGNPLKYQDSDGHLPIIPILLIGAAIMAGGQAEAPIGNYSVEDIDRPGAISLSEVTTNILPDMYGTHSSIGISIVMDGENGRSTYYDFETNRIHDARNISVGISAPGGHVDISRSFTWFDDDDKIDSYRALNGTSWQLDLELGPVVAGYAGIERSTSATTLSQDMITSFIVGGGVAPDLMPIPEPNFAGVVTWIPEGNSQQYDSNSDMIIGIIQHRTEKGQTHTFGGVAETFFIAFHAWAK